MAIDKVDEYMQRSQVTLKGVTYDLITMDESTGCDKCVAKYNEQLCEDLPYCTAPYRDDNKTGIWQIKAAPNTVTPTNK